MKSDAADNKLTKNSGNISHTNKNSNNSSKTVRMKKINFDPDSIFKANPYYLSIAKVYTVLKYITIVSAVAFTVFMLTFYGNKINAESFRYLLKDLDFGELTVTGNFDKIYYNGNTNSKFAVYKDEFVIVNSGQTSIYNSTGASSLSKSNNFYSPRIAVSDKYMLVYDRGNTTNSYAIYNSFSELVYGKFDYPISLAAISDSGVFAIVTRNEAFKGYVYIYNSDLRLISEIKKDKYVTSLDISSDGTRLVMASLYDSDGDAMTEIISLIPGSTVEDCNISEPGTAISLKILSNGNTAVMYTDCIIIYGKTFERILEISLSNLSSIRTCLGNDAVCVTYNNNVIGNNRTVCTYDMNGKMLSSVQADGELIDISINSGYVYLLFENQLHRIAYNGKEILKMPVSPNAIDVVYSSTGLPLVCYAGAAEPVIFENPEQTEPDDTSAQQ